MTDESDRLIAGLRAGDEAAALDFFRRYRPALERIAAHAIAPGLRRRVGPETVAQSVCRTFLRRLEEGRFTLDDGDALWRLLCAIALRKAKEKIRFHLRARRGAGREVPLSAAAGEADPGEEPAEAAAFREVFGQVLAELDEEEREMLDLRLAGRTQRQIAAELGCSERTVRRLLAGLEARLRGRLEA